MDMIPVASDNVRAVGYDPSRGVLRVAFRSGGVYDYFNVHPHLYEAMLLPHPWRQVGRLVRGHRYQRIAA